MHWADVAARRLAERGPDHVIATGITPSGPIHVGNMREVLTADAVFRAVRDLAADGEGPDGPSARLLYVGDTFDPLRKVYPFLEDHPSVDYGDHVGKPLSRVPCPCGEAGDADDPGHASYADHFLEPFLGVLDEVGVEPAVVLAHEQYEGGAYADAIRTALDHADAIRAILEEVAGRDLPDAWLPFNVLCPECGRFAADPAGPGAFDPEAGKGGTVAFACTCGHEGTVDVAEGGAGKLPWRVDWPARWKLHGVTFEPFGKDHAAAGGSWDTGVRIAEEVYGTPPPDHVVYEFLHLKGKGAMHSSKGTGVRAEDLLAMVPPEVMRFLLVRPQPSKHIDFDPGEGLVGLVDEYDAWERAYFAGEATAERKELDRVYALSQPDAVPDEEPPRVPFSHLVMVAQVADAWEEVVEALARSGYDVPDAAAPRLRQRLDHARTWLERAAPDHVRFELERALPEAAVAELSDDQRGLLAGLRDRLEELDADAWRADALHEAIHEEAGDRDLPAGKAFGAVYAAFLGRPRGPRAGHFLESLDRGFVQERLGEAAAVGEGAEGGGGRDWAGGGGGNGDGDGPNM